jgi:hypothetical protein
MNNETNNNAKHKRNISSDILEKFAFKKKMSKTFITADLSMSESSPFVKKRSDLNNG